jgi:hypothetical protein
LEDYPKEANEMTKRVTDLIGNPELIEHIYQEAQRQQLRASQPSRLESAADVLDAPLNPDDVLQALELIKIFFETATAALAFFTAVVGLFKTGALKEEVVLKNSNTGKTLGKVNQATTTDDIKRMLDID